MSHQGLAKQTFHWAKQKILRPGDENSTQSATPATAAGASDDGAGSYNAAFGSTGTIPNSSHGLDRFSFKAATIDTSRTGGNDQLNENNTASPPTLQVSNVEFLGDVHSETTYVKRDLGFQGQIGNHVILTYGDTMYTDANYGDEFRGMTSDSMALATRDPLTVIDQDLNDQGYPCQACPLSEENGEEPSTHALGITNAVETSPGHGVLYFLLNHRPNGTDNLVGAGLAVITLSHRGSPNPPIPRIHRTSLYWWDGTTEPWYGDVCALRWQDYIYAYGHAKDKPWVYLTRVRWEDVENLGCYEYWNGDEWQSERLQTSNLSDKESIWWQVNQGQVFWSKHHQCFLFVYCDNWMSSKILARTAAKPEGPWSEAVTLYQAKPITENSTVYAAVPHPYHDDSGKTLVVTFTNHPNTIQAVKVIFD